jgi:hypothetical protein
MHRIMVCVAMLTLGWIAPSMALAECCNHCGCQCHCCKVCRLVPEVKQVPKVRYECECEDFCVPGPSCIVGYECPKDDDCDYRFFKRAEPIWKPSCGCVRTRRKLVKIETMKEVKAYKCVVVNLCPHCCALNAKGLLETSSLAHERPGQAAAEPVVQTESKPASKYSQYEAGDDSDEAIEAKIQVAADETDQAEATLVSHQSTSPPPPPSLIERVKRSILGLKNPN